MKIDKQNKICKYNDEQHIYWMNEDENEKFVSVTTLIGQFHEKFDGNFWSKYKAFEFLADKEAFLMEKKALLATKRWNDEILDRYDIDELTFNTKVNEILDGYETEKQIACERGTKFHLEQEQKYYKTEIHELPQLGLGGKFRCIPNYYELNEEKGIYPEYLIYKVSKDGVLKVAGQIDLLIKDGNDIYILDYKGLPLDTPIATEKGWKKLEELTLEDKIFDKDGNLTNIKNISEIHNNPCYRINFDNGESIMADHEHRWLISFRKSKKDYIEKIMTTEDIAKWLENKPRTSYNIPKIMNTKPLNLPDSDLPIDPYIFGAWLGDGSKSCGIITNVNEDFWKEVTKRGYKFGKDISSEDGAEMHTVLDIRKDLLNLNVLFNKHVPNIYLRASYNQRLDLLRGLMDTDGYYNITRKRFVMATTQYWQAEDTAKIVASLGWKPTIIPATKYCDGKEFQGWDVCFTTNGENPFLIRNQHNIEYPKTDKASFRNIVSVEIVPTVQTKCLEVDSPSHTFLAGYTLIPTHNTNKKIDKKSFFDQTTKSNKTMYYPLNNIPDCNFYHYTLQLSTYAWMVEQINPEFKIKGLILIHSDHDGNVTTYNLDYHRDDVIRMLAYHKKQKGIDLNKYKNSPIEF